MKIIEEINKDIYDESRWVYVKLQSLTERLGTYYLQSKGIVELDGESIDRIASKRIMDKVFNVSKNYFFEDYFNELNRKANAVKHSDKTILYDKTFLKAFIDKYNLFVKNILSNNSSQFLLNCDTLNSGLKIDKLKNSNIKQSTQTSFNEENKEFIQINCGIGNQDLGFKIYNLKPNENNTCYNESIYAIIYNFLQRSLNLKTNKFITDLEEKMGLKVNYKNIYRYEILILQLIKNHYFIDNDLSVNLINCDQTEFIIASQNINHYYKLIGCLCNLEIKDINISFNKNGLNVCYGQKIEGIFILDNSERNSNNRDIWFAPNIIYNIDEVDHKDILYELLFDFFNFTEFKEGQLTTIVKTLNQPDRSICIMPTGSGKSLVFYMNILLSSCPSIIICPTNILIEDQKRNLLELHNIDDVMVCDENTETDNFKLTNKFIYLTPMSFQRYNLIFKIINYNVNYKISNIILDEIHTICNWSHDFRPDYLMLSHNLATYMDNCKYLGFTATANYKVLSDLSIQLNLKKENMVLPNFYDPGSYDFNYVNCKNEEDLYSELLNIVKKFTLSNQISNDKMIVFTNDLNQSKQLCEAFEKHDIYDISCFNGKATWSYIEFVQGIKSILFADSELGIGINFPNTNYIVHYGFPVSKAQYVQEIGRAGRDDSKAYSTVLFNGRLYMSEVEKKLISFETSIDEIINILSDETFDTNIIHSFRKILGRVENYAISSQNILEIYDNLKEISNFQVLDFKINSSNDINTIQKYLYQLKLLGIVDNWFVINISKENLKLQIEVDFELNNIDHIKESAINYLCMMGTFKQYTHEIQKSDTIKEIIYVFQTWFYNEFLYYHREQLLNVIEFFDFNSISNNTSSITKSLMSYFSTPFLQKENEKEIVISLSIEEIFECYDKIKQETIFLCEELIAKSYNPRLDMLVFLYKIRITQENVSIGRFLRSLEALDLDEIRIVVESLYRFYNYLSIDNKITILNALETHFTIEQIFDYIYLKCPKDIIYFGILSKYANKKLEEY